MLKTLFAPAIALGLAVSLAGPAAALPIQTAVQTDAAPEAPIIQVYGGCGPYGHRGPYGGCRTGGQAGGYVRGVSCPAGFHIGPYGRRCWPNRY